MKLIESYHLIASVCVGKYKAIIVESRESRNKEIPWFGHEDLYAHTKALDGYIFTI